MSDAAYMDAVAKGDMKTAQRMVDAAAEAAGLKKKNLVRTLFTPREVDEIRPRAIEAVRSMAENYVFNMEYSMDEEERWSNVGFENNKLGFRTSGGDSYSIKISYVNDTDDWMKIVETHNDKKSVLDYSLRPIEYKVPSDPVTYDDSGNVIPLSQRFGLSNPRQSMMGININDKCQDFTGQILRGEKTIETRKTRSLDPYIGERVGLVRTGVGKATLVGYATVGEPVVYDSVAKFRRDYDKHLVAPGSAFDIKDGLKYGYPLMQVESITPKLVQSKGIVARKLNPASRTVDEAAKKAGYTTKAFHRTSSKFTKFIPGGPNATRQIWRTKSGESRTLFGQSGRAMWFGTSPDNLPAYHNEPTGKGVVLTVYLKNPNPLQIDDDTRDWARDLYGDGSREFPLLLSDEHIKSIRDDGYTGIEYWQKGKTAEKSPPDEIVVFDANQIKSADLVTYDDAGNSIPISNRFSGKSDDIRNPVTPSIRKKLASVIEFDDRILCYDTAADEDFYRLWDIIHTDLTLNKESLREIEGMLDDDGVLVIESGETPAGMQDHFRKATRYQGLLLVQGPLNPEQARIETEKLRRDLE